MQSPPARSLPGLSVSYRWSDASAGEIDKEVTLKLEGLVWFGQKHQRSFVCFVEPQSILPEIYRLSNSRLEKETSVVLTHEPGRVRLNFGEEVVFQDEAGKRLTKEEVKKMSEQHDCWLEQKSTTIVIIRKRR